PRLMVLGLKGYIGGYELIASPGECITITGRIIYDRTGKKPEAIFRKMKAKGSQWQSTYARVVRDYIYHLDSLDTDMDQDYKGIKKIIFWAKQKNDEQAIADMYQTRDGQAYITRVTSNFNDRNDYLRILIERHKDSFLGPMLMLRFGERLNPQQQPLYDSLSETAKQSYYGREVKDEVYPPTMQGETAPTVNVFTRDGDNKLLNFTTHGNRLLLIDFWASWCQPCLKEIPTLKRIYETYHEQGLDIISISADQTTADWIEALDDQQIPWCNYIDLDRQAIVEYKVQYIPTIYLLDSRGRVIAEKLRGAELEDFIKKLFKK
ncbi:MAG: TlpA family protein disulfide reductase, partial [Bacteroidaceae bacterium]|nr:TlpA family protein disulfide reductase [Bacteroidaceae bacterium]